MNESHIAAARAVPIESVIAARGIKLRGKIEQIGACPICGGVDRFAINTKKQVFNCRQCEKGGDVIALVMHVDRVNFTQAVDTLAGPEPKSNGKEHTHNTKTDTTKMDSAKRVRVACFEYCYANGKVAFVADRFHFKNSDGFVLTDGKPKKTFAQRRPDPDHKGKWLHNVEGIEPIIYRLPEVIEAIASENVVLVVEGEAKADLLWSWKIAATCNSGGAGKWRAEHSKYLNGADVVLLPDNDDAGWKHAHAVGASLTGIAKRVRVVALPGARTKDDIIQFAERGGTREQLDKLIAEAPEFGTDKHDQRFTFTRFDHVKLPTTPNYLVKGMVPHEGITVFWGPPKCGKSFLTFDLAAHIALGRDYRGHKVRQGAVVYLALEGGGGFAARIDAWRRQHKVESKTPFYLLTVQVDLITDHVKLIEAIHAQVQKPVAVVIDTLNRSLNGSENDPKDMARYIRAADTIRETFRAAVLIVHHCGIAADRPRGHTSLAGANDAQIAIERDDKTGIITATVEHMKDGEAGTVIHSELQRVELGKDDDGDLITSCIIVPAENTSGAGRRNLSGDTRIAFDALVETMLDHGKLRPENNRIPKHYKACPAEVWRDNFFRVKLSDRDKRDTKKRAFNRAVEKLTNMHLIGVCDDLVWLAGQAGQGGTT